MALSTTRLILLPDLRVSLLTITHFYSMTSLSRWVRLAVAATAACALAAGCLAQEEAASVKLMAPAGGTSSLQFANAANSESLHARIRGSPW